jgi:hypothetical protein
MSLLIFPLVSTLASFNFSSNLCAISTGAVFEEDLEDRPDLLQK